MRQISKNVSSLSNEARNTYVIEHITDAFLELLKEKSMEEISISELCSRANIGRASFYRNFESKEGILRRYIHKLFKEWADEADKKENRPLNKFLGLLFAHIEKYRDFYSLLYGRGLTYLLKDVIIGLCGPKPEHTKEKPMREPMLPMRFMVGLKFGFNGVCRNRRRKLRECSKSMGYRME